MSEIDESTRTSYLNKLLDDKLGPFRFWTPPEIADYVGPRDLSAFDDFDTYRLKIVEACETKLDQFSDEQIMILITHSIEDPEEVNNEWTGWLKAEIFALNKRMPSWLSVGFGHPTFEADFAYWGLMEKLSLHEALLLSVGIEPKHFNESRLSKALSDRNPELLFPTVQFLIKRHTVFCRKYPRGAGGYAHASLHFLKNWFDEIAMPIHPKFQEILDRRSSTAISQKSATERETESKSVKELSSLERQTVLKILAAMACVGYKYDPSVSRNSATTDIQNDVASIGHSLDPKTILKWLREATDVVDKDYWKGNGN